jgi:hypothetical protein
MVSTNLEPETATVPTAVAPAAPPLKLGIENAGISGILNCILTALALVAALRSARASGA